MDWSNLYYFLTFARCGSLSAASKVLGTDHSTVARRIEALEKELKLRLVDRRARAYSLTTAGQQLRDLAVRVETAIGDIEGVVAANMEGVDPGWKVPAELRGRGSSWTATRPGI